MSALTSTAKWQLVCQKICEISSELHLWLRKQDAVGEESLTDWFLWKLSEELPFAYYQKFTRFEESRETGADWEWWFKTQKVCLGLRIQAKRLRPGESHYPGIAHSSGNVLQIDRLMDAAEEDNLLPLYCFYHREDADSGVICPAAGAPGQPPPTTVLMAWAKTVYKDVIETGQPRGRRLDADALVALSNPLACFFCCPQPRSGNVVRGLYRYLKAHYPIPPDPEPPTGALGVVDEERIAGLGLHRELPADRDRWFHPLEGGPQSKKENGPGPNVGAILLIDLEGDGDDDRPRKRSQWESPCAMLVRPPPPEDLFFWIDTPIDGRVKLWREIPAGKFLMGSLPAEDSRYDAERPRHEVTIKKSFGMAMVPITVAQYRAFDPEHRSYSQGTVADEELLNHPVTGVTWRQAMDFCRWLSGSFGWARGARLPTEEEWEYACRARSESRYWSGDDESDLDRVGWYNGNSGDRIHQVGGKPANPWGLYDVHGNVWEWTLSEWAGDYSGRERGIEIDPSTVEPAALAGSVGSKASGGARVFRGGSVWNGAGRARSAYRSRGWFEPLDADWNVGFRVVLPAAPSDPRK